MIKSSLKIYNGGSWQEYHVYNLLTFDERKDGQLNSASCIIITTTGQRFKPQASARLSITDGATSKTFDYYAYFNLQKRAASYWLYTVTLISITRRTQLEPIDGLKVIQSSNGSISLYDTVTRLLNTTPFRQTSQSNRYVLTTDTKIVTLLRATPSPEFNWSCRTLLWECLREIGTTMGGYIPVLCFANTNAPNGKYVVSFANNVTTDGDITKLDFKSVSVEVSESEVCSALDSDVANIISTNQETASIVYPAQGNFASPRTEEIRLTTDNCKLILPTVIEKPIRLIVDTTSIAFAHRLPYYKRGVVTSGTTKNTEFSAYSIRDLIEASELDLTDYLVEYHKWQALTTYRMHYYTEGNTALTKNNTIYWQEGDNAITISTGTYGHETANNTSNLCPIYMLICSAVWKNYPSKKGYKHESHPYMGVGSEERFIKKALLDSVVSADARNMRFRIEYIPTDTSTKLRATKQSRCAYEGIQVYNQRAEKVDSELLSADLKRSVNQRGVEYYKTVNYYTTLASVPALGTQYKEGSDTYELVSNEYEQTNAANIKVTHSWSKNWAMLSTRLMQNKEYRNTNIPTTILERNLYYEDYCIVSTTYTYDKNNKAIITTDGYEVLARVFRLYGTEVVCEVNNFGIYREDDDAGVVSSCASFGVANSIVFCGKVKSNVSIGYAIGDDWECHEVVYAGDSAEMTTARIQFGVGLSSINVYSLPYSYRKENGSDTYQNAITTVIAEAAFEVEKSSAEKTNFTYQIHFVTDNEKIVVGEGIASASPAIKGVKGDEELRIWGLTRAVQKTATVLTSTDGSYQSITSSNVNNWLSTLTITGGFRVDFYIGQLMSKGYVGWAVTDNKNRLILAYNEPPASTSKRLYFNFTHKFHSEA